MNIIQGISYVANYSGIFNVYAFLRRYFTKSQVAILMYHRVCPKKDEFHISINSEIFEKQMKYFSEKYELLSLNELVNYIKLKKSYPKKAIVITFDDGYKDNYLFAYPILQKYSIPATIFLATGYIGSGRLFWTDKVRYLIHHTSIKKINLEGLGSYSIQSTIDKTFFISIILQKLKKMPENTKNSLIMKLNDICQVKIPRDIGKKIILSWKEVKEMYNKVLLLELILLIILF